MEHCMNQSMKYTVRFSTYITFCLLGWLLLGGCSDHTGMGLQQSSSSSGRSSHTATTRTAAAALPEARVEAESFLKALCAADAKTASAKVAVSFKKEFFPPFYEDEKA